MLCIFLAWQEIFLWGCSFSFSFPYPCLFGPGVCSCVHGLLCIIPLTLLSPGSHSQQELEVTQQETDLRFKAFQNASKEEQSRKTKSLKAYTAACWCYISPLTNSELGYFSCIHWLHWSTSGVFSSLPILAASPARKLPLIFWTMNQLIGKMHQSMLNWLWFFSLHGFICNGDRSSLSKPKGEVELLRKNYKTNICWLN